MRNIKILVVDDSSIMRKIITRTLIDIGIGKDFIVQAVDGLDAIGKMKTADTFDLVLTDWNMPKMDGLTLVQNLRSIPKSKNTPIVMITTEGSKKEVISALKSGVNNYIVKPFTSETLKAKLVPILSKI